MDYTTGRNRMLGYVQLVEETSKRRTEFYKYGFLVARKKLEYDAATISSPMLLHEALNKHRDIIKNVRENKSIDW